jgi:melibiose permease
MIARVFDAANDPFMGVVVEKTRTKWGKFRPWIFLGTVTNALLVVALFAVPKSLGVGGRMAWFGVTYILWGVTYTLMDIPFWSMVPALTQAGKDRESLSVIGRTCAGIGDALATVGIPLLVGVIATSEAASYARLAVLIAVIFVISEVICVSLVREQQVDASEPPTLGAMFSALFHNDQAIVLVVAIVVYNAASYLTQQLAQYFFQYEFGNFSLYSLFGSVAFAVEILAMLCFPLLRKLWSARSVFIGALICTIVGYLYMFLLMSLGIYNLVLLCTAAGVIFVGIGLATVLTTVFLADAVDYGQWKTGQRSESVIFSMQTFVVKLASAISALIAGIGLKVIRLDTSAASTTAAEQAPSALLGLHILMVIIPLVGFALILIYFVRKYKLDEKTLAEISAALGRNKE